MRPLRRLAARAGLGLAVLSTIGTSAAMAAAPTVTELTYTVRGIPAQGEFSILYNRGVQSIGGTAQEIEPGWIQSAGFTASTLSVVAWNQTLSVAVDDWVQVGSGPITGTASIPTGATAVVLNSTTNQQVTLTNGSFSIPNSAGLLGGARPPSGTLTFRCKGSATRCTATVPIAGGASNRKVAIRLTDTNLRLLSVTAVPRSSRGAYLLTNGRLTLGGSQYVVTLNAVKANPKGSHLVLTFSSGK